MKKILFVNACVRPISRTHELAKSVLEYLDGEIEAINLETEQIPPLDSKRLQMRDTLLQSKTYDAPMLQYANQFANADIIVIAAPYWDLAFPSLLKIYMEAVTVSDVSFSYVQGVPKGLCKAERLIYVTTAGGSIVKDFGFQYIKALAEGFYGISDVTCIKAENLDVWGNDVQAIMSEAKRNSIKVIEKNKK